ncbi:hypothetical protein [Acidocella sp.]|uniref:hypothetical protein n=1 Tax=Acidocella sp. TaxID=50710 RepID=UPI002637C845|nr:hypothetical protein [Acidocella sp.]
MRPDGPPPGLEALEPGQLTARRIAPYPRRRLGPGVRVLLWVLRIYVLIAVPLVFYAFIRAAAR